MFFYELIAILKDFKRRAETFIQIYSDKCKFVLKTNDADLMNTNMDNRFFLAILTFSKDLKGQLQLSTQTYSDKANFGFQ